MRGGQLQDASLGKKASRSVLENWIVREKVDVGPDRSEGARAIGSGRSDRQNKDRTTEVVERRPYVLQVQLESLILAQNER